MKSLAYSVLLLAITAIYFGCGYSYSQGMHEPEYVSVPTPYLVETVVEVPVTIEKVWDIVQVYGVTEDGQIVLIDAEDESEFVYLITLSMNMGDYQADVMVWMPWGGGMMVGVPFSVPTLDYEIKVRAVDPSSELPPPLKPTEEGVDEF